jgi:hypothetical protein
LVLDVASPIQAVIILADAATVDQTAGKVHMLGAGWSLTSTPTPPFAVVVLIGIPWDRTNQKIDLQLRLLDADGGEVQVAGPLHTQPLEIKGVLEVGRPAGVAAGTVLDNQLALPVPPLPLLPGRYEWRLDIGEESFSRSFEVIAQQQRQA